MLYSELSQTDKEALWQAFDKRFPVGLSKEFLLKEAHVSKRVRLESKWETIFETLQERPRDFTRLLQTAMDMRPDDANLCEIVELLCPPSPVGWFAAVASVVCLGIVVTIGAPMETTSSENAFAHVEQTNADLAALERFEQASYTKDVTGVIEPIAEPIVLPDGGPEERIAGSAGLLKEHTMPLAETLFDTRSVELPTNHQITDPILTPTRSLVPNTAHEPSRCSLEGSGDLIGYWYAGSTPPQIDNGWTTIPHGVNVRIDFPEEHNNYNAKTAVSCVLFPNMRVPVQHEPILVAGGKYWIPLMSIPRG
jgi:hypothetical protein